MAAGKYQLPKGAWDSHVHVVPDEVRKAQYIPRRHANRHLQEKFPFSPDRPYTPKKADLSELLAFEKGLGIEHACVVAMSVYGADNTSIADALEQQQGQGRAVVCIDLQSVADAELDRLHALGARAIRINLKTFGAEPRRDDLVAMLHAHADKIRRLGWAIQIFIAMKQYPLIVDVIPALGVQVVVDHLGFPSESEPVQQQVGYPEIVSALRSGHIWIKLSGTYRFPNTPGLESYVKEVLKAAPDRIVWASDWPHTGGKVKSPDDRLKHQEFRKVDDVGFLRQCIDWCDGDQELIQKIWVDNPRKLWQY